MLRSITLVFFLLCLFSYSALWAQCPDTKSALENRSIPGLKDHLSKLEACQQHKDSLALTLHTLGVLYFQNDLDSAIYFTQKALDIRRELYQSNPVIDLGKSYHNLGVFYKLNGQYQRAKAPLKNALEVYRALDSPRLMGSCLELANIYSDEGEYVLAEDFYSTMINEAKRFEDERRLIDGVYTLGNLYLEKKEYPAAVEQLEQAQQLLSQNNFPEREANCYLNLGIAYYFLEDYPKSINYYRKAIPVFRKLEYCDQLTKSFNGLGRALNKYGKNREAEKVLTEGLQVATTCGYPELIALTYDNLGEHFLDLGQAPKALANFQLAIRTLIPAFKPFSDISNPEVDLLSNVSNKVDLLVYFSDKSRALQALPDGEQKNEQLQKALELYHLGDYLIDELRREHTEEGSKLFWREQVLPFYEKAVDLCYQLNDATFAFFLIERSKAALLREALQDSDAFNNVPDSLRRRSNQLKKQLISARENLEIADEDKQAEAFHELLKVQDTFNELYQKMAQEYPRYFEPQLQSHVIQLEDYQKQHLRSEQEISVHYFYGAEQVYALKISKSGESILKIGKTSTIEKNIRDLLQYFEKASMIENNPADFLQKSYEVYTTLIEPIQLKGDEKLLIYPAGALAYLPFEVLTKTKGNNIANADYLIRNHVIWYGHSVMVQKRNTKLQKSNQENSIAAFAPFANQSFLNYPTLSFSNDELSQIQQMIAGNFLTDEQASKNKFFQLKDQNGVLHLSTHAFSSPSEEKPRVIFADTALYLSELYALDLDAEMVVLSACQTNIGKLAPGEGVMSLGRGFTHAGTKSLVSSLWNVNANATSRILSEFYTNLQEGQAKDLALHAAKLKYLSDTNIPSYERSPYYWAGLVYYGNTESIRLKTAADYQFLWWVLVGAIVVLAWYTWRRR